MLFRSTEYLAKESLAKSLYRRVFTKEFFTKAATTSRSVDTVAAYTVSLTNIAFFLRRAIKNSEEASSKVAHIAKQPTNNQLIMLQRSHTVINKKRETL